VRVALTGGGTGGHVYPALAIAEALETERALAPLELLFLGTRDRLEARLVPEAGRRLAFVAAAPLVRGLSPALLRTLTANLLGLIQALAIFHRFRPDVLIATGGYVTFPVVLALRLVRALGRSRARIALLEPNAVAGLTNRLLAPLVDEIWLGVPGARTPDARTHVTGTPVRTSFLTELEPAEARRRLGLDPRKTTIVVMGGSQGARRINDAVAAFASVPLPEGWQLLHLCGEADFDRLGSLEAGAIARGDVRLASYLDDPYAAYAAADLLVGRAGASTLAELAATGTPALLVPYPHATDDHQRCNAEGMARAGAAVIVTDAELDGARLAAELAASLVPERLAALRAAALALRELDPRAAILARVKCWSIPNAQVP